jgi:YebC/PmpR family DNA-binding regulatory protein
MSGHSKWATIKRKKGAIDAARGRLFTRLIREIAMAARSGGDPEGNPRLRLAIETARKNSMPIDNIKRAVARGSGQDSDGGSLDEMVYEGYGPGGIAVIIEAVTDNRNRTVAEIRHLLQRNGGAMAEAGAVSWNFHRKGVITIPRVGVDEDTLMMDALDAGAEDIKGDEENIEVHSALDAFEPVRKALEAKKYPITGANLQYVPGNLVKVSASEAEAVLKFMDAIEEQDDVQNVHSNFDIDESMLEALS